MIEYPSLNSDYGIETLNWRPASSFDSEWEALGFDTHHSCSGIRNVGMQPDLDVIEHNAPTHETGREFFSGLSFNPVVQEHCGETLVDVSPANDYDIDFSNLNSLSYPDNTPLRFPTSSVEESSQALSSERTPSDLSPPFTTSNGRGTSASTASPSKVSSREVSGQLSTPKLSLPPSSTSLQCSSCAETFPSRLRLKRHAATHTVFKCDHCPEVYKHAHSLDRHKREQHTETFAFNCDCGKCKTNRKSNYLRHLQTCGKNRLPRR